MQKFKSISAVLLALLVFMSTNSFAVNMHFCGDHLMDMSIMQPAKTCAMHNSATVQKSEQCRLFKSDCCKDVQKVVKGQDELSKTQTTEISAHQFQFLKAYVLSLAQLFQSQEEQRSNFAVYSPPRLVHDLQLLDEVYLI